MAVIERLVASTAHGHLLVGLFWRAPTVGQGRSRALLRRARSPATPRTVRRRRWMRMFATGCSSRARRKKAERLPKGTLSARGLLFAPKWVSGRRMRLWC